MNRDYRAVTPAAPAAGYIGGKRQLARRLIERIERVDHTLYGEAFVGMGGVFLRRGRAPRVEVINDASRDVATFFRVLQRHYQAFLDCLKWQLSGRAEFERLMATDPDTLTDLERAARFLYLQRLTFGGKVAGRTFGVDTTAPARFDTTRLGSILEGVHERLAGVTVECLGWREFLSRWDRPYALFYIDPPYVGTERAYGAGLFPPTDHEALAEALQRLKGRFLLTMSDTPEARAIYRGFRTESVTLSYQVGGGGRTKRAREMIVSGGGRSGAI